MRQRLSSLKVTAARVEADGRLILEEPAGPIERLLASSAQFAQAVRDQIETLRTQPGYAQQIWPGTWLVPLAPQKRRYRRPGAEPPLIVAILLTPQLLDSEPMQRLCANQGPDASVTAQINSEVMLTDQEVQRLAGVLAWMGQDATESDRRTGELHNLSLELAESYEELSLLYKLSHSMTVSQPPSDFLQDACHDLQQVVGLRWMALQLIDDDPRLNDLAGQLFVAGPVNADPSILARLGKQLMMQLGATVGGQWPVASHTAHRPAITSHQPQPMVIEDTAALGPDLSGLARVARNVLVVPLMSEQRRVGIFFGGDKLDGSHISSVDAKLCNSLANSLAIFLQNRMLYEDMQAMFMGSLRALTSSIDAKDSYTYGHTERVAMVSRQLTIAAGLNDQTVERLYLSAMVHDVGKIGVPERVLTKPGTLTDEEFDQIKMHPEIGARILADIPQMKDLIPGVLYHHERWDGDGYPHGLVGQDIPLFGRLIGLADAFDAMSSNRTYRPSMAHPQVLTEITRCAGTQFDPELAEVFVRIDFDPFFELIAKHQRQMTKRTA